MNQQPDPQDSLAFSYLDLRKAVGIIGFALPFVLALGKMLLQGDGLQSSISGYYYTDMRNVFVGSLCAIGVFLISTTGYDWRDEVAGWLAGAFAIGVALVPTSPCTGATSQDRCIGYLHLTFAGFLFATLAYFCLKLFTQSSVPKKDRTRQKIYRNWVYLFCGWTIVLCIVLSGVVALAQVKANVERCAPVFWFESIAIVAFGAAWLIKGETILKDQ